MATLAELTFPRTAIVIGWSVFGTIPDGSQWIGIAVLALTIVAMSQVAQRQPAALGVRSAGVAET